jgi:[NiFe] hydrogenase large subunit
MATSTKITIDPITRIEGHLKIEVEVSEGVVKDAWSSGTLFRGIELILKDRDAEDAWYFTQRVCGVCTYVHGSASVRCVEDAYKLNIPDNARIVRNLLMGGQFLHDHPIHFYHLHGLDWIDIVKAIDADASKAADVAKAISSNPPTIDFSAVKTKLAALAASGQLGPFAGGYWGHPAYLLSAEENLVLAAHYLYALRMQLKAAEMHAIFGAKNPHVQTLRVGGVTCKNDKITDKTMLFSEKIPQFRNLLTEMRSFIDNVYVPDVKYLAKKYSDWKAYGGFANYLAYGDFPTSSIGADSNLFPGGVILNKALSSVDVVDLSKISEHVTHSWYSGSALHPSSGQTLPNYTGYDAANQYSWLKAPRYDGNPMEVGPLARVLIAYAKNAGSVKTMVDSLLTDISYSADNLHSALGRTAARALETKIIADAMETWLSAINSSGDIMATVPAVPATGSATGVGLNEAPRGALGHWINVRYEKIDKNKSELKNIIGTNRALISNYQMVVPSTWNLGPRDSNAVRGPVEQALIGTPVADAAKPLEILRIVHSYDPCLACAVHVIDTKKDKRYIVRAV